ncbi:hypothetical protein [Blastomonas sp. AAP53]|uniref:hypothetical protein n=1 Tax=Blastomonas sp. AAP53 TaxID=1248760 RepID=UPI00187C6BA2|nr:hypothetical protein [Blastomonas sp. AAP53]
MLVIANAVNGSNHLKIAALVNMECMIGISPLPHYWAIIARGARKSDPQGQHGACDGSRQPIAG